MLAVVLPWFVAIGLATHGAFFRDAVGGDLGAKLAGGDDAHGAPPGMHLLLLSLTLFPAAPLAICRAARRLARQRREPATRFLLAWLVPAWMVFEAVPTKLPHYVLPLLPALCLLAAAWLPTPPARAPPALAADRRRLAVRRGLRGAWRRRAPRCRSSPRPGHPRRGPARHPRACGGRPRRLGRPGRTAPARSAAARHSPAWSSCRCSTGPCSKRKIPNVAPVWIGPRIEAALAAHGATGFAAAGYAEPSLMFAAGTATAMLPNGTEAARFLAAAAGRAVLVERRRTASASWPPPRRPASHPRAFAEIDGHQLLERAPRCADTL